MALENDAPDTTPQEEKTVGEEYAADFAQEKPEGATIAEDAEPVGDEPTGDETEKPEETPEGETTDEPEEGLTPLDDEEEEAPEEPAEETDEKQIPFHVVKKEREKRQAAERELAELRQRANVAPEQPYQAPGAPPQASEVKAPVESDFEDRDDFLVARARHEANQDFDRKQAANAEAQRQGQAADAQRKLETDYTAKVNSAIAQDPKKFGEYDEAEKFISTVGIHGMAMHSIMTADKAPEIVHYLNKKPSEAARIASLPPLQQVEEIGYLKKRSQIKPQKRKVTKASEPVSPERGDSSPPEKVKFSNDMSQKDYEKLLASKGGDNARVGDLMEE